MRMGPVRFDLGLYLISRLEKENVMKIKVSQLRRIIAEEVRRVLTESDGGLTVADLQFDYDQHSSGVSAVVKGSYDGKPFEATASWGSPISGLGTRPDEDFLKEVAAAIESELELDEGAIDWHQVDIPQEKWNNFVSEHDDYAEAESHRDEQEWSGY